MAISGLPSLDYNLSPIDQFPEKWYPILDPNSLIYIPFTMAHTCIAHIWPDMHQAFEVLEG